jgi:hypothetical protein
MTDPNEITALQASFRGALNTAGRLTEIKDRVDALDPHGTLPADFLDELSRAALAHAVASAALRGLVNTIVARHAAGAA